MLNASAKILTKKLGQLLHRNNLAVFAGQVFALLLAFYFLDFFFNRARDLGDAAYREPYLFIEVIRRLGWPLVLTLSVAATALLRWGKLALSWSQLAHGTRLRWFVLFLSAVLVWPFTTLSYNYIFDQGYYLDRLLILSLFLLVAFRPVFLLPLLLLLHVMMGQLVAPGVAGSILAHKLQVFYVLEVFAAWFVLHGLTGGKRIDVLLLMICCVVASSYWQPALEKIQVDWIMHGHLYRLLISSYAHGWLAFLEPDRIVSLAGFMSWFDWPMRIFVLLVETAFLVFLLDRRLSLALLTLIIIFHLSVFILMGFLFWTWIAVDAALLVLLARDFKIREYWIYRKEYLLVSVLLIGCSHYWVNQPQLGWYDTRISTTFRLVGVQSDGSEVRLVPQYFRPYEDTFTLSGFTFLVDDHGSLVGPYGVSHNPDIAYALNNALAPQDVFELEASIGKNRHHALRSEYFAAMVRAHVENRNRYLTAEPWPKGSLFLPQFWSQYASGLEVPPLPIKEVRVEEVTTLFDEVRPQVIRVEERLRIPTLTSDDIL